MKLALCPAWAFVPTLNVGYGGTTGRVPPRGARGFTSGPWSDLFSTGPGRYVWFGYGHYNDGHYNDSFSWVDT